MSGDWMAWWIGDGDWYDRRQRRQMEEGLAAESAARSHLRRQLLQKQGTLETRLDRLSRVVVAMMEYEDIRSELTQYADSAAVRRYARELLSTLAVTGSATVRDMRQPADVPGYWLSALARGVVATVAGEPAGAELLAEASRRDPRRTAVLLTLIDLLRKESRWSRDVLDAALPTTYEINRAERDIWLGIAQGRLGEHARAALVRSLRACSDAEGRDAHTDRVRDWLDRRGPARTIHERDSASAPQVAAADRLEAIERLLRGGDAPNAPARRPARGPEPASGPGAAKSAGQPASSEDPTADCLRSLVDEGGPGEVEVLDRMAEVRALMDLDGRTTARTDEDWDSPVGNVLELLLRDAAGEKSPQRDLAIEVLGPVLREATQEAKETSALPVDETARVDVSGLSVTVTPDGTTEPWEAQVRAAALQKRPVPAYLLPAAAGCGVLALIGFALMFLAGWFAVLGVLALIAAAVCALRWNRARVAQRSEVEAALGGGRHAISYRARQLAADGEARADAQSRAAAAAGRIEDLLPGRY